MDLINTDYHKIVDFNSEYENNLTEPYHKISIIYTYKISSLMSKYNI